jgi:RHS repeat-associated protein
LTSSPFASTYTYGPKGERQSKTTPAGTWTYKYDARGNLRSVQRPGGLPLIEYIIDGLNRRVGRKLDGVLHRAWLYADARVVAELDGSGALTRRFAYGTRRNVPDYVYVPSSASTYRLVTDHLGSVRLVVEVSAVSNIVQQVSYDAWGKVVAESGAGFQPFGYAGGIYDADTGLVRFGARDYDPETGRWLTKDPIGFGGGDPNLYAYVLGDPINRSDPSGTGPSHVFACLFEASIDQCLDDEKDRFCKGPLGPYLCDDPPQPGPGPAGGAGGGKVLPFPTMKCDLSSPIIDDDGASWCMYVCPNGSIEFTPSPNPFPVNPPPLPPNQCLPENENACVKFILVQAP